MTTIYGIKTCDSVKKTQKWLTENHIDYHFHDFRAAGLSAEKLDEWLAHLDWQKLINKRSTSWRQLTNEQKATINPDSARQFMLGNPTLIKRPVIEHQGHYALGFNLKQLQSLFTP